MEASFAVTTQARLQTIDSPRTKQQRSETKQEKQIDPFTMAQAQHPEHSTGLSVEEEAAAAVTEVGIVTDEDETHKTSSSTTTTTGTTTRSQSSRTAAAASAASSAKDDDGMKNNDEPMTVQNDNDEDGVEEEKKDEAPKVDYSNWPLKDIREPHANDVMFGRGGEWRQPRNEMETIEWWHFYSLFCFAILLFC